MIREDFTYISSQISWDRFANKTIFITGANGFLPAYICETLLLLNDTFLKNNPCKVLALCRSEINAKIRFKKYLNDVNLTLLIQDVSDDINVDTHIDFIIHAASPASPKYYGVDPVGVIKPNIYGTSNTLELAKKNNVESYLYFSSGEVYGDMGEADVVDESYSGYLDILNVRSCYAQSKRMGETLCISYYAQHDVPVKIVRPAHTYGPGMKLDDGRVFADFVKNVVNGEDIVLKSDGSATRSFCYIADATIAFLKILLNGNNGEAYNMANPSQTISIKDLAKALSNISIHKEVKVLYGNINTKYMKSPVIKIGQIDISKLRKLGWEPITTIQDGFTKTIRSYNETDES